MSGFLKAVIIDDEEGSRSALETLLGQYAPEVKVVAACASVPEGALAINKHDPDIVFLDVEMPEYNGFELVSFFKQITFDIIFVTAYSQYAVKAFEVSALDYLLKPVEIEALKHAVKKARDKRHQASLMQRLELMKDAYKGAEIHKIALPVSEGLIFVEINDIVMFEADRVYTHAFLKNGSKFTVSKPMRAFEDILSAHSFIYRPHRSYLINLNHIKKYIRGESTVIMDNGQLVSIARERKSEFEEALKKLRLLM